LPFTDFRSDKLDAVIADRDTLRRELAQLREANALEWQGAARIVCDATGHEATRFHNPPVGWATGVASFVKNMRADNEALSRELAEAREAISRALLVNRATEWGERASKVHEALSAITPKGATDGE
jgi:hypothetical protein